MARSTKKATVKKTTTKKATVKKSTKKAKAKIIAPALLISSSVYEGALKARRVIKNELDPKLENPNLFARYCYFNQIVAQYEAQQNGDWLDD